jgi:hypothetical protein
MKYGIPCLAGLDASELASMDGKECVLALECFRELWSEEYEKDEDEHEGYVLLSSSCSKV